MSKLVLFIFLVYASAASLELQKPQIYHDQNVTGWVMSEKLDGIRGYWNGRFLFTKSGYKISVPKYFIKNFPSFALDGELLITNGSFEDVQSVVLDNIPSKRWRNVTYNIFEAPNTEGNFTKRIEKIKEWFKKNKNEYVRIVKQFKINSKYDLYRYLDEVCSQGGEGVIVKDASLEYFTGRSSKILKLKKFQDMEGVVISINPGKGKYKGMMGSLRLKLKNGVIFNLGNGFSYKERKKAPKIGDIVTFKYFGFTKNGKPKFASFIKVRDKRDMGSGF